MVRECFLFFLDNWGLIRKKSCLDEELKRMSLLSLSHGVAVFAQTIQRLFDVDTDAGLEKYSYGHSTTISG